MRGTYRGPPPGMRRKPWRGPGRGTTAESRPVRRPRDGSGAAPTDGCAGRLADPPMSSSDHLRLERLLARLRELERLRVPSHERPILEVARASLLEAITALAHRLHDSDYFQDRKS